MIIEWYGLFIAGRSRQLGSRDAVCKCGYETVIVWVPWLNLEVVEDSLPFRDLDMIDRVLTF